MKKEKIECGGCGGIWGNVLALGRNLPGSDVGLVSQNISAHRGETSGFTTASTAKGHERLVWQGLRAVVIHRKRQGVHRTTAKPSCEYSIRWFDYL